jgi:hypothetical protein
MELCRGKILLLALAACIAFSVVFTTNLAAVDIDHDCTGENCPYCLHIETAKGFLKALKTAGSFSSLTGHLAFTATIPENNAEYTIYPHSPIALKVRFNS